MKLFLQKNAKFSSAGGSAPRPPCLRRLGASPPNPQPPAAGGFAPTPPLASGGWGLCPQTPQTAPPLRISGYAPAGDTRINMRYNNFEITHLSMQPNVPKRG